MNSKPVRAMAYAAILLAASALLTLTVSSSSAQLFQPIYLPFVLRSYDVGTIVFREGSDFDQRVYSVRADGSQRVDLTETLGITAEPVWSPDGSTAVFAERSDLGSRIIDVWVARTDGSGVVNLTNFSEPTVARNPHWSPDGSRVIFAAARRMYEYHWGWVDTMSSIFSVNVDGSDLQQHVPWVPGAYSILYPRLSPDGQHIAYVDSRAVNIVDLDQSLQITIYVRPYPEAPPEWSPDGTMFVFNSFACWDLEGECDILLFALETVELSNLTPDLTFSAFRPMWSPDGSQLAFGYHSSEVGAAIATLRADGSELGLISVEGYTPTRPLWSPDGQRLAFYNATPEPDIFTVKLDGSDIQRATSTAERAERLLSWEAQVVVPEANSARLDGR